MLQTKDKPQSYPFTIPHFFTTISKSGVNLKENISLQLLSASKVTTMSWRPLCPKKKNTKLVKGLGNKYSNNIAYNQPPKTKLYTEKSSSDAEHWKPTHKHWTQAVL